MWLVSPVTGFKFPANVNKLFRGAEAVPVAEKLILLDPSTVVFLAGNTPSLDISNISTQDPMHVPGPVSAGGKAFRRSTTSSKSQNPLSLTHLLASQFQNPGRPTSLRSNFISEEALLSEKNLDFDDEMELEPSWEISGSPTSLFSCEESCFSMPSESSKKKKGNLPIATYERKKRSSCTTYERRENLPFATLQVGKQAGSKRMCNVQLRNIGHHLQWGHHVRQSWRQHVLAGKALTKCQVIFRIWSDL